MSGPVVFAGYGISAPELGYDDYAGIDAKGKIVLIFNHEPQENDANSVFNGTGNTRYTNATYKALNAQRHGAIGILAMTRPNNHHGGRRRRGGHGTRAGRGDAPRIPSEALVEGGPAIPTFTISAKVPHGIFAASGQEAARRADGDRRQACSDVVSRCPSATVGIASRGQRAAPRQLVQRGGPARRQRPGAQGRDGRSSAATSITTASGRRAFCTAPTITARARSAWWNWRARSRSIR